MDKKLKNLHKKCRVCKNCSIGCKQTEFGLSNVFSNMVLDTDIMIVGQRPGKEEVKQALPFVGISGKYFIDLLWEHSGLRRDDVYLTNVVKCFSSKNSSPSFSELENCRDFLDEEVALINPKLIVTLGEVAFRQVTGMRGIAKHCNEIQVSIRYSCRVLPLYHPSLRPESFEHQQLMIEGLKALGEIKDETFEEEKDKECYWCTAKYSGVTFSYSEKDFCSKECLDDYKSFNKHTR